MAARNFVGRHTEMALLDAESELVRESGAGRLVVMRGRRQVGSWWNRAHDTEIDLVGVPDPPDRIAFVGSIKWRDRGAFDDADARDLASAAAMAGLAGRPLHVGVSRAGFDTTHLDLQLGPDDLVTRGR
ncbi:MAG: DUF234 domain-containing protein [Pseudonocardiaceae bacterium]